MYITLGQWCYRGHDRGRRQRWCGGQERRRWNLHGQGKGANILTNMVILLNF